MCTVCMCMRCCSTNVRPFACGMVCISHVSRCEVSLFSELSRAEAMQHGYIWHTLVVLIMTCVVAYYSVLFPYPNTISWRFLLIFPTIISSCLRFAQTGATPPSDQALRAWKKALGGLSPEAFAAMKELFHGECKDVENQYITQALLLNKTFINLKETPRIQALALHHFGRYVHNTGWFKLKTPNFVPHECRTQYLLKRHIFGIILTPMNSGRG